MGGFFGCGLGLGLFERRLRLGLRVGLGLCERRLRLGLNRGLRLGLNRGLRLGLRFGLGLCERRLRLGLNRGLDLDRGGLCERRLGLGLKLSFCERYLGLGLSHGLNLDRGGLADGLRLGLKLSFCERYLGLGLSHGLNLDRGGLADGLRLGRKLRFYERYLGLGLSHGLDFGLGLSHGLNLDRLGFVDRRGLGLGDRLGLGLVVSGLLDRLFLPIHLWPDRSAGRRFGLSLGGPVHLGPGFGRRRCTPLGCEIDGWCGIRFAVCTRSCCLLARKDHPAPWIDLTGGGPEETGGRRIAGARGRRIAGARGRRLHRLISAQCSIRRPGAGGSGSEGLGGRRAAGWRRAGLGPRLAAETGAALGVPALRAGVLAAVHAEMERAREVIARRVGARRRRLGLRRLLLGGPTPEPRQHATPLFGGRLALRYGGRVARATAFTERLEDGFGHDFGDDSPAGRLGDRLGYCCAEG
ncbi:MAG: hypothetical protein PVG27_05395 [Chloroflexota bacterium]